MKKCITCRRVLDDPKFNKDRGHKDGLRSLCRGCQSKHHREWRKRRLKAGLCYDCGKPRPPGWKCYCPDCLKERERLNVIYEQQRKERGICRQCGKHPIDYTRSMLHCSSCLDLRNYNKTQRLNERNL